LGASNLAIAAPPRKHAADACRRSLDLSASGRHTPPPQRARRCRASALPARWL
jgi:hypothetical protein